MASRSPTAKAQPAPSTASLGTVIGAGTRLEGVFDIDHDIRVEGILRGRLKTSGRLHVYPDGQVEAQVEADAALIEGRLIGRLRVRTQVQLTSTAHFTGVILTPLLQIDEGAVVEYDPDI